MSNIVNQENTTCQSCDKAWKYNGVDKPRVADVIFSPDTTGDCEYNTVRGILTQAYQMCKQSPNCPYNIIKYLGFPV